MLYGAIGKVNKAAIMEMTEKICQLRIKNININDKCIHKQLIYVKSVLLKIQLQK